MARQQTLGALGLQIGRRPSEIERGLLEQALLAEDLGSHCIWEVEPHGLYEYSHSSAPEIFLAFVAAMAINSQVNYLHYDIILDATVLAFVGHIITRYRSRLFNWVFTRWFVMRKDGLLVRERVLIVGAGDTGQFVAWRLMHTHESSNYKVIGFVDDDMYRQGLRMNGLTVLGKRKDISELVQKHDIGVIIFAIHNISTAERASILKTCRSTNAQVVTWPDTINLINAQLSKTSAAASPSDRAQLPQYPKGSLMLQRLDVLEADLSKSDFAQVIEDIYAMRTALQENNSNGRTKA